MGKKDKNRRKKMIKVTVWNEFLHEKMDENIAKIYPKGIHGCIADFLRSDDIEVRTATLEEPECGLTDQVLRETDVLLWWGHIGHAKVPDEIVDRVQAYVLAGMGLVVFHSGHHSKIFKRMMGTSCNLGWRENDDLERIWTVKPSHPIAQGLGRYFDLPREEVYCEPFDIPEPDELVFGGWFEGGEIFRSGCCWKRGNGKIFYFQPGHESFPTFHNKNVQLIIRNAVKWAYSDYKTPIFCPNIPHEKPVHVDKYEI